MFSSEVLDLTVVQLRKASMILLLVLMISSSPLALSQPEVNAQKAINARSAVVRYLIFFKSNYSASRDITFVWSFRQTEWSKVEMVSSTPSVTGSGYINSRGDSVGKDDFLGFQAFGWRFDRASPSDILQVDFKVNVRVSAFSPSTLTKKDVGTIDDAVAGFSKEELGKYRNDSYYWDYQSAEVKGVINQIKVQVAGSKNVYDIVRGTLAWFAANTMYSYPYEFDYPTGRIKASEILKQTFLGRHYGVCRHYVDVFTAIMRGFGIPTVTEEGLLLVDRDGELNVAGRHAWAVVYFPGVGWKRVDVTVPDRSTLDMIGVGLSSYPVYYVPEQVEFTNTYPTSENGTVYPYIITGGSIKVEQSERSSSASEGLLLSGLLVATLLLTVLVVLTRVQVRKLERKLNQGTIQSRGEAVPAFCTSCGTQRASSAQFCVRCGQRFY